ncbi:MAG TPA: hypothetical protein ENK44_06095 [Caldithrix abyssi]|uniref:Uncharacterized protein n=1 Tax=Caldithrix abyssi TaxID=187145 RepID=A0A7V4WUV2_CALAY|nr:hypothetical protein [Caldithrix abyssi]
MLSQFFKNSILVVAGLFIFMACQQSNMGVDGVEDNSSVNEVSVQQAEAEAQNLASEEDFLTAGYEHGPIVIIDGVEYYLAPGAPDGPNGATDIPGHYWKQLSFNRLQGRHFNTGPFGKAKWWSSDAPDGSLLFIVSAVIDTWSMEKAKKYAKKGFVHYHEFVTVADGSKHPTKVLWLRHIAVRSFTLDGGPHPELAHEVEPGLDWDFIPNGMMPYDPSK